MFFLFTFVAFLPRIYYLHLSLKNTTKGEASQGDSSGKYEERNTFLARTIYVAVFKRTGMQNFREGRSGKYLPPCREPIKRRRFLSRIMNTRSNSLFSDAYVVMPHGRAVVLCFSLPSTCRSVEKGGAG